MIAPCKHLEDMLGPDARAGHIGTRAVCHRHQLFGIVLRDLTIGASRAPFRQQVYAEPATADELARRST
jgi:hypothetical protein